MAADRHQRADRSPGRRAAGPPGHGAAGPRGHRRRRAAGELGGEPAVTGVRIARGATGPDRSRGRRARGPRSRSSPASCTAGAAPRARRRCPKHHHVRLPAQPGPRSPRGLPPGPDRCGPPRSDRPRPVMAKATERVLCGEEGMRASRRSRGTRLTPDTGHASYAGHGPYAPPRRPRALRAPHRPRGMRGLTPVTGDDRREGDHAAPRGCRQDRVHLGAAQGHPLQFAPPPPQWGAEGSGRPQKSGPGTAVPVPEGGMRVMCRAASPAPGRAFPRCR